MHAAHTVAVVLSFAAIYFAVSRLSLSTVQFRMLRLGRKHFQVLWTIVLLIAVDVMDNFSRE